MPSFKNKALSPWSKPSWNLVMSSHYPVMEAGVASSEVPPEFLGHWHTYFIFFQMPIQCLCRSTKEQLKEIPKTWTQL